MNQKKETTVLLLSLLITVGVIAGGWWWLTKSKVSTGIIKPAKTGSSATKSTFEPK